MNVRPGEWTRVGLMILYSAAAMGGVLTVGLAVSATLFLSELPASAVPFTIILPAIAIVPALLVYNRLAARFRFDQVVLGSDALLLGLFVLFRILLDSPQGRGFAALASLFVLIEVAYTLVLLQFWSLAGQVFNPREAKRLFGFIAGGGTLASVIAGLSLATLVTLIGVENLLWVIVLALGACIACAWAVARWQRRFHAETASRLPPAKSPTRRGRNSLIQDLRAISQSRLLLAIGGLTVLVSLLINIAAYAFYLSVQANFGQRGTELASYLGAYAFWAGLGAFFTQFYLTGRLMNRFGVSAALLFYPLGVALGAALSLLTGGALWAFTLIRAADPIFRRTINSAALNVLYLPTPAEVRDRAKEIFESVYALTFGTAGLIFLLLQQVPAWNLLYYSIPLLVLAGGWLALLAWTRRQYADALVHSLKRRVLDLEGATINFCDEATVRVLTAALQDPDELRALHALQLIASAPAVDWGPRVAPLLKHPSPAVRLQALQHLGHTGAVAYTDAVAAQLEAPEPEVRAAAVEAYCALAGAKASARIMPILQEANLRVKGAAILALLKHGDSHGVQSAAGALKSMLASERPAARQAGAQVVGLAALPEFSPLLVPLFDDANLEVRLSAIRAVGPTNDLELLRHLARKLNDKTTASAAVEALVRLGGAVESELRAVLGGAGTVAGLPPKQQNHHARSAAEMLLAHFRAVDESVRGEVYRALARVQSQGFELRLSHALLREAISGELRDGYLWITLREDLGAEDMDPLLSDAIRDHLRRTLDRVFSLLSVLYPQYTRQIRRVRQALDAEPGHTRAMAVELLDNLAERPIKDLLLPLVEAPVERVLEIARGRFGIERRPAPEWLGELAQGSDPWLRICAIHRIGTLNRAELAGPVLAALDMDDAVLRETALAACRTLVQPQRFVELLTSHAADDRFPTARRYAQGQLPIFVSQSPVRESA